jgi:glucosyl-dolichyl phosphate glucuronosyltransferase
MDALRIAVCTNRPPAAVAACLKGLAADGVSGSEVLLVTSGLGAGEIEPHRAALAAALPGARLVGESRAGLSHARNAALEAVAEEAEVVAYVDDDAVVVPGWQRALRGAWARAEPAVACIGGPIRPRFAVPPPRWLSPPLLPTLTVLDHGPRVLDLDPEVRTVYGANISFRIAPLRAVGGFDPAFGHAARRLWFSEEDEAQRALVTRGHVVRYDPEPAVWHVIPRERLRRRAFVRRRFAYGATLGVRGARPRALALRQGVRSGAGVAPALVRGDHRRAMERAVRAAENAGVLLGPKLARRSRP